MGLHHVHRLTQAVLRMPRILGLCSGSSQVRSPSARVYSPRLRYAQPSSGQSSSYLCPATKIELARMRLESNFPGS